MLRRPPLGHVLETAHDMGREHRLLAALAPTGVPVPRAAAARGPGGARGALLRDGVRRRGASCATGQQLAALDAGGGGSDLADELVDVPRPAAPVSTRPPSGSATSGGPRATWSASSDAGPGSSQPRTAATSPTWPGSATRLAARRPDRRRGAAIVHGDYRLDNVVVDQDGRAVVAVLDWEMATLGDPLADVASSVVWWDGLAGLDSPVAAVPADVPGFPGRDRLLSAYADRSGLDLTPLPWYLGFAFFKIAAIFEGIHYRAAQGLTVGDGFGRLGVLVAPLTERGHAALDP